MKKIIPFFALLAVILTASCSKQPQGASLVPDDATVVYRLDIAKCAKQAGFGNGSSTLGEKLKGQLAELTDNKALEAKLSAIIDDPMKSGIDFSEPVFAYVSGRLDKSLKFGLVGAVSSQSKLETLVNDLLAEGGEEKLKEANGAKYTESDDVAFIFTADWFYFGSSHSAKSTIAELNDRAAGTGSLSGHKAMERLCAQDGMMQLLVLGKGIAALTDANQLEKMLPDGLKLDDIATLAALDMKKGEATLTSESIPLSKEWEDFDGEYAKLMKPIGKEQAKYISDKGFSLLMNVDLSNAGKWIDQLATLMGYDDEEGLAEAKEIVASLDGTLSLDFYGMNEDGSMPLFTVYAGSKDATALDYFLAEASDSDELEETGDHMYQVPMDYDYDYDEETGEFSKTPSWYGSLGYQQGQTYLSLDADNLFAEPATPYPFSSIKGQGLFMRFNFSLLDVLASNLSNVGGYITKQVAHRFDYAEFYVEDGRRSVLRLVTKDKDETPLEAILALIEDNL